MTCAREPELYAPGPLGRSAREHVEVCAECAAQLARLEDARALLSDPIPPLGAEARARLWRELARVQERPEPWWWRWVRPARLALAGAAAASVLALALAYGTGDRDTPPPVELWAVLAAGETYEAVGGATLVADSLRVVASEGATLSMEPGSSSHCPVGQSSPAAGGGCPDGSLRVRAFTLSSGTAAVELAPGERAEPLAVWTPEARIEVIGTRFTVTADREGTRVSVERGSVRVTPRVDGAGPAVILGAGQEHTVLKPGPRALAEAADHLRRSGRALEAAEAYARLAADPRASGYVEEALLRRAAIFHGMGRTSDALAELDLARARFPRGALVPERAALYADLHLSAGRLGEAVRVLEAIDDTLATAALSEKRIELAEKLLPVDPARARALAERVARGPGSLALRRDALRVAAGAARAMDDAAGADALARELERLEEK